MKYSTIRWATFTAAVGVISLFTAGFPSAVQAQTTGLRVNIPFEFHVGEQVLPPGIYMVWLKAGSAISVTDGKGLSALRMANVVNRPNSRSASESTLVFTVYGNRYFLNEVRWAGYIEARTLLKSKDEIEIAKAIQPAKPTTAAVASK